MDRNARSDREYQSMPLIEFETATILLSFAITDLPLIKRWGQCVLFGIRFHHPYIGNVLGTISPTTVIGQRSQMLESGMSMIQRDVLEHT